MHYVSRRILFVLFLTIFLVGAPTIVLYTAGYRYNTKNGHIVRTGVLAVSSDPRGATIGIDGNDSGKTTPYVFGRMMPGTYRVTLTKTDYHAFDDDVTIESGKTTYVNADALFPASEPLLLTAEPSGEITVSSDGNDVRVLRRVGSAVETWRYDLQRHAYQLVATEPPAITSGNILLTRTPTATEVRRADAPDTVIALLPSTTVTLAAADGNRAVLRGENDRLYMVDVAIDAPLLLATYAVTFDWNARAGVLVWTDGFEINTYNTAQQARKFVTRQSNPISAVALSANGMTVFAATATAVTSFNAAGSATHNIITLATMDAIEQCWTRDGVGDALYVVGTRGGVRGIYELALR